jgi:hypothetical protein
MCCALSLLAYYLFVTNTNCFDIKHGSLTLKQHRSFYGLQETYNVETVLPFLPADCNVLSNVWPVLLL